MVATKQSEVQPTVGVKFLSAGLAACIGDAVTFPLDTAKVRLQIQGEGTKAAATSGNVASLRSMATQSIKYKGMAGTLATITKEEGARALYNGLAPGLQRQLAFASIRIGLYDSVKHFYMNIFKGGKDGGNSVVLRIMAGVTTGGLAVTVAQPTDVVKVRMQAQPRGGSQRYTGAMHAYRTIARREGMAGLWKGSLPNIARNSIVNACEMVSYDLIKMRILRMKLMRDNMPCHIVSGFGAGFCTTVLASPVDVVKTRFMNSAPGTYKGAIHCAIAMFKNNGAQAFYKGFMPSFMRLGSWNVVMFVSYEQLKRVLTEKPRPRPPPKSKSYKSTVSTISLTNHSAALVWRT